MSVVPYVTMSSPDLAAMASRGRLSSVVCAAALALFVLALPGSAHAQDAWATGNPIAVDTSTVSQGRAHGRGRVLGSRPRGCPSAWCACWLARHLGKRDRRLWLARNWLTAGPRISHPQVGAVAVYARGRRGGHVGIVKAIPGPGKIVLLSGNDGGRVRVRERSTRGVIGYVMVN